MNKINDESLIRNNLKKYRIWKRLTRKQLALELNISTDHLYRIENDNKYPKYQIRAKLCKYFDVSQSQMFYYNKKEDD